MDEYPNDLDLKVVVEDKFGLREMQEYLQSNSCLLANTSEKRNLSVPVRRGHLGYSSLNTLKQKMLESDQKTKSTAFYLNSNRTNQDLRDDLESLMRSGHSELNENIELTVTSLDSSSDNSFSVTLSYKHRQPTRRNFLNTQDRSITLNISSEIDQDSRIVNIDYRYIDQFHAAVKFLQGWRTVCLHRKIDPVQVVDVDLTALPLSDRVALFNDFFTAHPGNWKFEHVSELGIERERDDDEDLSDEEERIILEQAEEIESELDQRLGGLTDAILRGREGLLESSFVQDCIERDFYFTSATAFFSNVKDISGIELKLKFKRGPRPSFATTFEGYYEKKKNSYIAKSATDNTIQETRDLFRGVLMNQYADRTNQQKLIQNKYAKPLTELEGIGPKIADRLSKELNIKTVEQVFASNPDELQRIKGIGEARADSLTRAD